MSLLDYYRAASLEEQMIALVLGCLALWWLSGWLVDRWTLWCLARSQRRLERELAAEVERVQERGR